MQRSALLFYAATVACAGMNPSAIRSSTTLGARLMLAEPINQKCAQSGVKNCDDITEGLLLYVESKKEEGTQHLRVAAASNSPDALRSFARAINALGDIPGTGQYMGPLLDAARFLDAPATGSGAVTATFTASGAPAPPPSVTPIPFEDSRLMAGIATPLQNSTALRCVVGGLNATCVRSASGPIVVTGVFEVGQCKDRAFALASNPGGDLGNPRWAISVGPNGPTLVGLKLPVRPGEALFLALQSPASTQTNPQCAVTWSGYRVSATQSEYYYAPVVEGAPPPN